MAGEKLLTERLLSHLRVLVHEIEVEGEALEHGDYAPLRDLPAYRAIKVAVSTSSRRAGGTDEPKPWRWVGYNFGGDAFWDMRKDALQGRLVDADGNTILWATTTEGEDPRVEVASEEIARAIANAGKAFKTIAELGPLTEEELTTIENGDQPGRIAGNVTGEVRFAPHEPKPLTDEELDTIERWAGAQALGIEPAAVDAATILRLVAEVRRLRAEPELLAACRGALHEMRHTVAPRNSFTDAVDALDAAITRAERRAKQP